jgi:carboxypeptidase Q
LQWNVLMKRLWIAFFCSVATSIAWAKAPTISDADIRIAEQLRDKALQDKAAFTTLESLTTEIGQRLAGSPSDAKGREWATAQFKKLGFDKIYSEKVEFPVWERGFESCEVISPFPQKLSVAALGGSMGTPANGISAEVMEFADFAALSVAPDNAAAGKIVFVSYRMTPAKDGAGYGPAVIARVAGASMAAKKGAVAILIRSIGTDYGSRSPHTGVMKYDNTPTRIPAAALSNIDADLLQNMLKRGQPVKIQLALGARTKSEPYVGANVIGEITGSKWPDRVVLIGGHLDSWDLGTGAIDDGAGVAITMAAGALIGQLPKAPKRTIRVVAFANEEQGVYGGKAYAAAHAKQASKHLVGAESDFGADKIWRFDTAFAPAALPIVDRFMQVLAPLGIERGSNDGGGGADVSPMREHGMALAELQQDGTHYFDIHHTANDTFDKVDAASLAQNVAAYAAFAYLAQVDGELGPPPAPPARP